MRLYDLDNNKELSILDLYQDYLIFKSENEYNHAENFTTEYFEILMATINERNNLEIIGCTGKEISNIIFRLMKKVNQKGE